MTNSTPARRLGFISLIFYGVGDILGAGIYALVGKVIGLAGAGAWASFLFAGIVAALTGLSYAELSSRIPVAAGAAAFVRRAFPGRFMATLAGVFVLGTGLASSATVTVAFSGYLHELLPLPDVLAQIFLLLALSFLSFWGIHYSSRVNIFFTLIEFSGLLAVIGVGAYLLDSSSLQNFWQANTTSLDLAPILSGATLAFFAFVGFEDLCNLADEAKNPSRDIPRAILIALSLATLLYLLVTLLLQMNFHESEIAQPKTPLLLIFQKAGLDGVVRYFSLVAILAIANTGMANLIMASRLLYGMSREGLIPSGIGKVHSSRKTPWVGILIAFGIALFLVLTGSVKILAQTTSLLVLMVFVLVHLSLIRIKRKKENHQGMQFSLAIPILGTLCCVFLLFQFPLEAFLRSLIFFGLTLLIWEFKGNNQ